VAQQPSYNTDAIRELLRAAYSNGELDILVYDWFRPIYGTLSGITGKDQKIQCLLEFVERYGMYEVLLEQVQQHNSFQYARFAEELEKDPLPVLTPKSGRLDDLAQAYFMTLDAVKMLEKQKRRYGTGFVPARFAVELSRRREDIPRLKHRLERAMEKEDVLIREAEEVLDIRRKRLEDIREKVSRYHNKEHG
jgi:hypothetical protein